ncbi:Cecropin-P2 [Toxocara canis]|uniref:Cecropin-P2 n=1 Tax=Toxocara canis TaxID=6265 RepID=A0A0B2URF6_TOXCA|nr:Cecropin-P2 [Toxocara canis]
MFATRRALVCVFLIYLLLQPAQTSWLSKTYKKLENSAKKRIAEGKIAIGSIAIAIQGGPRRRRFVSDFEVVPSDLDAYQTYVEEFLQD